MRGATPLQSVEMVVDVDESKATRWKGRASNKEKPCRFSVHVLRFGSSTGIFRLYFLAGDLERDTHDVSLTDAVLVGVVAAPMWKARDGGFLGWIVRKEKAEVAWRAH